MGVLTLPLRGLLWVFEEVAEQAERELYDASAIRAQLAQLYQELQAGRIADAEFELLEAGLALRLEQAEEHNAARRANGR